MTQKHFLILFVLLTIIGVLGLLKSNINKSSSPNESPFPSDLFNQETLKSMEPKNVSTPQIKQYSKAPAPFDKNFLTNKKAVITTKKGVIEFEIYPEATMAASNFIFLAQDKFYDGLKFHRVVPGFVIQGGDPRGDGTGDPGYRFRDEPVTRDYVKGIVAMANAGQDTNGSQFFIMLEDNPTLPKNYTIFGKVISGQELISQIRVGDTMDKVTIEPL